MCYEVLVFVVYFDVVEGFEVGVLYVYVFEDNGYWICFKELEFEYVLIIFFKFFCLEVVFEMVVFVLEIDVFFCGIEYVVLGVVGYYVCVGLGDVVGKIYMIFFVVCNVDVFIDYKFLFFFGVFVIILWVWGWGECGC